MQDAVLLHLDFTWTIKTCAFPEFHPDPGNTAHAFLDSSMEADATYSRSCTDKHVGNWGVLGSQPGGEHGTGWVPWENWTQSLSALGSPRVGVLQIDMLLPALLGLTPRHHVDGPSLLACSFVSSVTSSETEIYLKVYPNLFNF